MQQISNARAEHRAPFAVLFGEILAILDPLIEEGEDLLVRRDLTRRRQQGRGIAGARRGRSGRRRRVARTRTLTASRSPGVLRQLGNAALARIQLRDERFALFRESAQGRLDMLARIVHFATAIAYRDQETHSSRESLQVRQRIHSRHHSGGLLLRRGVLLHHCLDALVHVAAGIGQLLIRLLHLILVELQLRLGHIQLILQRVVLRRPGLRERGGELSDTRLVRIQQLLRGVQTSFDLLRLRAQHRRMRLDATQRRGEGEIQVVVRGVHGVLCDFLLLPERRFLRQLLRCRQISLVDGGQRLEGAGCAATRMPSPSRGRMCRPQPVAGQDEKHEQHGGENLLQNAHGCADLRLKGRARTRGGGNLSRRNGLS